MAAGLAPWEFEILARELLLNADKRRGSRSFASWHEVARCINSIKHIENETWARHSVAADDIYYELVRIAHRQFPWQRGLSRSYISSYLRLYGSEELCPLFVEEYGMSPLEMIQLTMALSGHFHTDFTIKLPMRNELNAVTPEVFDQFVRRFAMTIDDASQETRIVQEYNINWAYTFNPLRSRPLLRLPSNEVICPIPTFLLRRGTSEVYFDLVRYGDEFSRRYGPSFQRLVGHIASTLIKGTSMRVFGEEKYGPKAHRKDSIDWIIEDDSGTIFVECKASRVRYKGISDLKNRAAMDAEFDRIRGFCKQLYKTLADAIAGRYGHWSHSGKPLYPVVVTLEDWESFGVKVEEKIIIPLRDELAAEGINPAIIDEYPPSFCSLQTFDGLIFIAGKTGIELTLRGKVEGEHKQWALDTYLSNRFGVLLRERADLVLEDDWNQLGRRLHVPREFRGER